MKTPLSVKKVKTNRNTTHYFIVNGEVKAVKTRIASQREMIARAMIHLNAQTQG